MAKSDTDDAVTGEVVSADVANVRDSAGTVVKRSEFDKFLMDRQAEKADVESDPFEEIIKQVLNADSPDAVLTPTEVLQGRDLIGVPLVALGFALNQSEFDVGSPFYATIDAVKSPDEPPFKVNCGHKKVIAQLVKLEEFGAFPVQVKFITRGTSKVGGTPMLELTNWDKSDEEAMF
jgi:hypothetical protein